MAALATPLRGERKTACLWLVLVLDWQVHSVSWLGHSGSEKTAFSLIVWCLLPDVGVPSTKWVRMSFSLQGRGDSGSAKSYHTSELVGSPAQLSFTPAVPVGPVTELSCPGFLLSTWMKTRQTSRIQSQGSAGVCSETPGSWKSMHLLFEALVPVFHMLSLVSESRASQGHSES